MAVIAPFSRYKKNNYKIYIVILLVAAVWFSYDGYRNESFIKKHTVNGTADATLKFHKKAPPFMLAGAAAIGVFLWFRKKQKIVAEDSELVFSETEKIPYDSIQSIDKTKYQSKGFFVIGYTDAGGAPARRKVSDRNYDNLTTVLDLLVKKITS